MKYKETFLDAVDKSTYYAEWDKVYCDGHLYALVIVPTRKVAFLLYRTSQIDCDIFASGVHYNLALTRNRDISKDIGSDEISAIVNRQGLCLPDEELPLISFPSRLIQLYLV